MAEIERWFSRRSATPSKVPQSGASPQHIKPSKYESQMSFLQPYMSSGPREGNLLDGSDDESQLPSQPSTNGYLERQYEESSQLDPGLSSP